MKTQKILFTIFCILLISCNKNSENKNDLELLNLFDKVISIEEVKYLAVEKFGEITTGERKRENSWENDYYIVFNEDGFIESKYEYDSNGNFYGKSSYLYNEKNKVIEVNNYTKDLSLYFKEKFSYNNLNYLTNYFLYNSEGELEEKSNYQYNENGKMKEAIFNSNTEYGLNGKYEYKYNDKNELIESKYFSLEGVIEDYSTFGYDKNGNLVLSNHFNDNGDLIKRTIYKYNDKNKLIEEADYNNKDIIVKFKKNQYDQFGNIYKEEFINSDDSIDKIIEYNYKYDSKNNWVKKIEIINGISKYITIRLIGYTTKKEPELINVTKELAKEPKTEPKINKSNKNKKTSQKITYAKYSKVENGMDYKEVFEIIGVNGKELSRSSIAGYTTVMYMWDNPDGSNMNIMFQNGKVITKAQFGLQ